MSLCDDLGRKGGRQSSAGSSATSGTCRVVRLLNAHLDQRAVRPSRPQPVPEWCVAIRRSARHGLPVARARDKAPLHPLRALVSLGRPTLQGWPPIGTWRPLATQSTLADPCARWGPGGLGGWCPSGLIAPKRSAIVGLDRSKRPQGLIGDSRVRFYAGCSLPAIACTPRLR
jgi:hypothetical protein